VTSPDSSRLAPRLRPSRLALFALVCGIAGVLLLSVVGPFIAVIEIPVIICGHSARRNAREKGQGGSRLALAALVIG
jgi:hypothetical protein